MDYISHLWKLNEFQLFYTIIVTIIFAILFDNIINYLLFTIIYETFFIFYYRNISIGFRFSLFIISLIIWVSVRLIIGKISFGEN